MANITDIWLFTWTRPHGGWAGTAAYLELTAVTADHDVSLDTTNNQSGNTGILNPGDTAQYHWSQAAGDWDEGALTTTNIKEFDLEIEGEYDDDTWLPNTIFIVSKTEEGVYNVEYGCGSWNKCFSSDPGDCEGSAQQTYHLGLGGC